MWRVQTGLIKLQMCTLHTQFSHCMIDNCKADWALIYRQVMRACNYVHVIITDGVVLREVNKVRQKMFSFDWRVRQRLESGKRSWISHQSVQRNVNGEMAQSGLKLNLWFNGKCLLAFLWIGFWWLVVVEWVRSGIFVLLCVWVSQCYLLCCGDEDEVLP